MASILRQIVAGPRARHPEAGLDLCYVTDNIIATSGPSGTYPQLAYRNPLSQLVKFLDSKHGEDWSIWEFRAEGTGYPDSEVYNRVFHYPWPDHHPPPFALIPLIMASMRNWLKGKDSDGKKRVVVVHCKAGKGRSGTASCSYLISEEGWSAEDALKRFTERRMRPGFGAGVSIPSQLRWVGYVDRWTKHGKLYVERPVQILEVHIWGLRDGLKVAVEGFVDEGRTIKTFHVFSKNERTIVRGNIKTTPGLANVVTEAMKMGSSATNSIKPKNSQTAPLQQEEAENAMKEAQKTSSRSVSDLTVDNGGDVIFRPSQPITLPTNDINIDFERRNKAGYGMSMVTAVAHVWFNAYFEGKGPENNGSSTDSGVFEIDWDAMDGIKGSLRKGTRAFDKLAVVWKSVTDKDRSKSIVITEPGEDEEVAQTQPADWRGRNDATPSVGKDLGLRAETPHSANISRASSTTGHENHDDGSDSEGVKSYGVDGVEEDNSPSTAHESGLLPTSKDLPGPTHEASHQ